MPSTCHCDTPQPFRKPSGTVVCLNQSCGGKIEPPAAKKERA